MVNEMSRLFEHVREDTCIFCGRSRAIELYDKNDNPIRFSFILDSERYILLDAREVHYGECKYCGKRFLLDWRRDNKLPVPLLNSSFKKYLQQYNKSKIV